MDDLLDVLYDMGGAATTYQMTRYILGRDRNHPDIGTDWEFLNVQDDIRTRLRRLSYKGHVARERVAGTAAPQWLYRVPVTTLNIPRKA